MLKKLSGSNVPDPAIVSAAVRERPPPVAVRRISSPDSRARDVRVPLGAMSVTASREISRTVRRRIALTQN